jgi:hypothetical protein
LTKESLNLGVDYLEKEGIEWEEEEKKRKGRK